MTRSDTGPRSIAACQTIAALCVLQLFAAPLATRFGLISYQIGLPLTALAVVVSALLLLASLVMLLVRDFRPYRARLLATAVAAMLPVGAGIAVVAPASGLPVIHDVSTDLADPPQFDALLAARGPEANPLQRSPEIDAQQRSGYPQLQSLQSPLPPAQALERAAATARALGWELQAEDAANGRLEASETTFWFGFTDDVVIRVRPQESGSLVDLRSVSRVGRGDLGANARRIERFIAAFPG